MAKEVNVASHISSALRRAGLVFSINLYDCKYESRLRCGGIDELAATIPRVAAAAR